MAREVLSAARPTRTKPPASTLAYRQNFAERLRLPPVFHSSDLMFSSTSALSASSAHTAGVAKNSLHIQAEAIDLRMPGIDTLKLRNAALALARGGVGYYPHSDFIHLDVGRVRQWCFDWPAILSSSPGSHSQLAVATDR
jgi:Bacterial protein of unknown function (DUF882)